MSQTLDQNKKVVLIVWLKVIPLRKTAILSAQPNPKKLKRLNDKVF